MSTTKNMSNLIEVLQSLVMLMSVTILCNATQKGIIMDDNTLRLLSVTALGNVCSITVSYCSCEVLLSVPVKASPITISHIPHNTPSWNFLVVNFLKTPCFFIPQPSTHSKLSYLFWWWLLCYPPASHSDTSQQAATCHPKSPL